MTSFREIEVKKVRIQYFFIPFRSPEEDLPSNISATNENVTFREKRDYGGIGFGYMMDRSPIETTTEL